MRRAARNNSDKFRDGYDARLRQAVTKQPMTIIPTSTTEEYNDWRAGWDEADRMLNRKKQEADAASH